MDNDMPSAYEQAYAKLVQTTLNALSQIESEESVQNFISDTIAQVKQQEKMVAEFYTGEFTQLLKDAEWEQRQADILALELTGEEALDEGKAAGAELTERLTVARRSGDRQAQHAVWRERESRLVQVQAKVENATARIRIIGIRRRACEDLAGALGM